MQHAFNPVDWYPWSDEAFQRAKEENKPVFLSIGYSTCHWCHVMEHESFEDFDVAAAMNESFISIKVDREERPDIDQIYMSVCQMMTGSGGWPLTLILTPEKKPFFAGTYFPKESRYGRIGLLDLIEKVNDVWNNQRDEVDSSADKIVTHLSKLNDQKLSGNITDESLHNNYESLKRLFDTKNGGFGTAPKFPSPHNLFFLMRYFHKTKDNHSLQMVENTLQAMSKGGIFDHIGFGFHRYSTDQKWLLPHFEKMLYDQATISYTLIEAFALTKNILYKNIAKKIFAYVERDMLSPKGYFYSAEDADSEGVEGKFYTWTSEELKSVLSESEYEIFSSQYNIAEEGNFENEATRTKEGTNIPFLSTETEKPLPDILHKLFTHREKRIRPLRDDKMLTDWNSLMIASFAYAARAFNNRHYLKIAESAARFILSTMLNKDGSLAHTYKGEVKDIHGKLDDYSFFVFALLELYNSTFDVSYLESAININEYMLLHFYDSKGGFYLVSDLDEVLLTRPKNIYDSAIPAGSSVAAYNLVRLSKLTGNQHYLEIVNKYFNSLSGSIKDNNTAFSFLLSAYMLSHSPSKELIITEENTNDGFKTAVALCDKYLPELTTIILNKQNHELMNTLTSYSKDYPIPKNGEYYYLCENYNCNLPEGSLNTIMEKL